MICIIISIIILIVSIAIRYKKEINILQEKVKKDFDIRKQKLINSYETELKEIEKLYKELKLRKVNDIELLDKYFEEERERLQKKYELEIQKYSLRAEDVRQKMAWNESELLILEEKRKNLEEVISMYYENEQQRVDEKVKYYTENAVAEMTAILEKEQRERNEILLEIQQELEKHQAMRAAVNEDIMRERKLQEQSKFYTINLSEQEIADLLMIKELAPRFNNRELLNKIIYESYIKRPLQEMTKRVLEGRSPSGIYKITRKSTGEIYIGRATAVDKRWTEHVKMAFSIGSIAHSTLHTLMEKEGVWNFTFELLEEVPKDQLNEREKYYIDFYDSKKYGLNQKNGS